MSRLRWCPCGGARDGSGRQLGFRTCGVYRTSGVCGTSRAWGGSYGLRTGGSCRSSGGNGNYCTPWGSNFRPCRAVLTAPGTAVRAPESALPASAHVTREASRILPSSRDVIASFFFSGPRGEEHRPPPPPPSHG